MISKNFEQWLAEDVERTFDIEEVELQQLPLLQELVKDEEMSLKLPPNVQRLQNLLTKNVSTWNEDELQNMFISPLLLEINFNNYPHYKVFMERRVSFKTEKVEAAGKVEWMVAQGKQIPRNPFFFLHEYKSEKSSGNDPLGQLLIAMIYAKSENEANFPLYGIYIIGRLWFFVLLEGDNYAVSPAFDATKTQDLATILSALQKVKQAIHSLLKI